MSFDELLGVAMTPTSKREVVCKTINEAVEIVTEDHGLLSNGRKQALGDMLNLLITQALHGRNHWKVHQCCVEAVIRIGIDCGTGTVHEKLLMSMVASASENYAPIQVCQRVAHFLESCNALNAELIHETIVSHCTDEDTNATIVLEATYSLRKLFGGRYVELLRTSIAGLCERIQSVDVLRALLRVVDGNQARNLVLELGEKRFELLPEIVKRRENEEEMLIALCQIMSAGNEARRDWLYIGQESEEYLKFESYCKECIARSRIVLSCMESMEIDRSQLSPQTKRQLLITCASLMKTGSNLDPPWIDDSKSCSMATSLCAPVQECWGKHLLDTLRLRLAQGKWRKENWGDTIAMLNIVLRADENLLTGSYVGDVLPMVLCLVDDTDPRCVHAGTMVLRHIINVITVTEFRWHQEIVFNALQGAINFREPVVLNQSLLCLTEALAKAELTNVAPGKGSLHERYCSTLILHAGLMTENELIQAYLGAIRSLIAKLEINAIVFFKPLLRILSIATCKGGDLHSSLHMDVLLTLETALINCWPRIFNHRDEILNILLRTVLRSHDRVEAQAKRVLRLLEAGCGEESAWVREKIEQVNQVCTAIDFAHLLD